ncbi:MAG: tetratricopeptide repeat protein [Candidatus Omnitrophica bacterium]|nr:tetratricopeptide repeat protein [Candidatus Omnitrophota bacterium]
MYLTKIKINNPVIFACFFVICFCLYFNALNNDFILDDHFLITGNTYVKNFEIGRIFSTDVFHFHPEDLEDISKYYRPLQLMSYSFEYLFWKLNPFGYRLDNIILQSLNSFLVFLVIYLLFKNKTVALLSGIFFCVLPLQVSVVAFISGRSNLLETLFMLSSLAVFISCVIREENRYYYISVLFYIAALLTREGALLLPAYIFICALFLRLGRKKIAITLAPYVIIGLAYIILRNIFMPSDKLGALNSLSFQDIAVYLSYLHNYLWQLILPLSLKIGLLDNNWFLKPVFYFCSFLILAYLLFEAVFRRNKIIAFGLIAYFIGLLPVIKLRDILIYFGPVLCEHYVYNASIGFCAILAYYMAALLDNYNRLGKAIFIAIVLYFSFLTIITTFNYQNEVTFYKYVLSVDKDNTIAHLNLGNAYYVNKDYKQAINEAERVLRLEPYAWDAYLLLGNISRENNELKKAEELYRKAAFLNPKQEIALNNLGLIYKEEGKYADSLAAFNKALAINPESSAVLRNMAELAGLFIKNNKYDMAIQVCEKIFSVTPYDAVVFISMGINWAEGGYFKEAELFFKEALRIDPSNPDAIRNLGALYGNMGKFDEAIRYFEMALKINPRDQLTKEFLDNSIKFKNRELNK